MIGKKQLETKLEYTRTGIILFTTEYQACVEFYSNVLELPVMFTADNEHSKLTCCGMGGSYLMIETNGPPPAKLKTLEQNPLLVAVQREGCGSCHRATEEQGR